MSFGLRLLVSLALPSLALSIAINNGIVDEPEVQCGPTSVQLSFSTQAPFEGTVYSKEHYADPACRQDADGGQNGGGIEIVFNECNSQRLRSVEPRGVFVSLTVVVQFHKSVLTKIDKAYHIRCFYMEADKTVDTKLEVSMVTTDLVTLTVPMPVCRYQLCEGDINGNLAGPDCNPIQFALIGQKVVHKWTCDTETVDTFCMEVYSCTVDDQQGGEPLGLVDEFGCSLDGNLVPNPSYPMDLMAEASSHVFKWADRPALYFNCQIRIGIKEPGSDCAAWREAEGGACPQEAVTLGRKKRSARKPRNASPPGALEMDVMPERALYVGDLELSEADIPLSLRPHHSTPYSPAQSSDDVCMSTNQVGLVFALLAVLFVAAAGLSAAVFLRRSK